MAKVSVAERRRIEEALLRLLPTVGLIAWRDVCESHRDSAEDSRVWHYWQRHLAAVRGILEARECPRSRGRDMPSVDTPLCSCGALAAPQDILCVDCAARADADISAAV